MSHLAVSRRTGSIVDATRFSDVKALVVNAIRNESKKPDKQLWRKEPGPEAAKAFRVTYIRRLKRHHKSSCSLALKRLSYCSGQHRCFSGGCPECARLFQRACVRGVRSHFRNGAPEGCELVAISIIPVEARVTPGHLDGFDIDNFIRRNKSKLKRAGLEIGIGAVDFSFNQDDDGRYEDHWCPHIYIIGWTKNAEALKASLKKLFKADKTALRRPFKVVGAQSTCQCISYAFKWRFQRRITYFDEKKARRNTDKLRLLSAHEVELCVFLDRIGLAKRLICVGLKPYIKKGRLRLRQA